MPFAWDPGSVSRFSEIDPRNRVDYHLRNVDFVWNTNSVQHWRNRWRAYFRPALAKGRKTQCHHVGARDLTRVDSGMGVRNIARCAGGGIVLDADWGAGRVWCYPGALE